MFVACTQALLLGDCFGALTALVSKTSAPKEEPALSLSISFVANRGDLACHAFLYWSR